MAVLVLTDADITVTGVVLSDKANSVTLNYEIDSVEVTSFGSVGHKFTGGLQNNSCDIEFMQDFAATEVEATIFPLVGTTTTVTVRGTFLAAHTPVAAAVGELAMTSLSFTGGTLVKTTS